MITVGWLLTGLANKSCITSSYISIKLTPRRYSLVIKTIACCHNRTTTIIRISHHFLLLLVLLKPIVRSMPYPQTRILHPIRLKLQHPCTHIIYTPQNIPSHITHLALDPVTTNNPMAHLLEQTTFHIPPTFLEHTSGTCSHWCQNWTRSHIRLLHISCLPYILHKYLIVQSYILVKVSAHLKVNCLVSNHPLMHPKT